MKDIEPITKPNQSDTIISKDLFNNETDSEEPEQEEEEEEEKEPTPYNIAKPEPSNNTFICEDKRQAWRIEFNSNLTMNELLELAIQTKIKLLDNNQDEK